ncbi:anamorsin protein [Trifolium repens]|nr:anamorsin protein [Trifolium repens]
MATTARATAAGAAALLYYTLNRKLQTQTTIDEDGDESGSNAPTDVQFCVTHSLHMKYLLDCSSGLIDENSLLPEEDLKKPVLSSGNCEIGTTRKACENCSCGMVEEGEKVLKLGLHMETVKLGENYYHLLLNHFEYEV